MKRSRKDDHHETKNEKDDLSEQDKKKIRKVVKQILETIGDE